MFYCGIITVLIISFILYKNDLMPGYAFASVLISGMITVLCKITYRKSLRLVNKRGGGDKIAIKIVIDSKIDNFYNFTDKHPDKTKVDNLRNNTYRMDTFVLPDIPDNFILYKYIKEVYDYFKKSFITYNNTLKSKNTKNKTLKDKKIRGKVRRFFINVNNIITGNIDTSKFRDIYNDKTKSSIISVIKCIPIIALLDVFILKNSYENNNKGSHVILIYDDDFDPGILIPFFKNSSTLRGTLQNMKYTHYRYYYKKGVHNILNTLCDRFISDISGNNITTVFHGSVNSKPITRTSVSIYDFSNTPIKITVHLNKEGYVKLYFPDLDNDASTMINIQGYDESDSEKQKYNYQVINNEISFANDTLITDKIIKLTFMYESNSYILDLYYKPTPKELLEKYKDQLTDEVLGYLNYFIEHSLYFSDDEIITGIIFFIMHYYTISVLRVRVDFKPDDRYNYIDEHNIGMRYRPGESNESDTFYETNYMIYIEKPDEMLKRYVKNEYITQKQFEIIESMFKKANTGIYTFESLPFMIFNMAQSIYNFYKQNVDYKNCKNCKNNIDKILLYDTNHTKQYFDYFHNIYENKINEICKITTRRKIKEYIGKNNVKRLPI
jgi:hypothetical protein